MVRRVKPKIMPVGEHDLDAIDALARRVQSKRWTAGVFWSDGAWPHGPYTRDEQEAKAIAAFIAAMSPEVVLDLTAEVTGGRIAFDGLVQGIERLRMANKRLEANQDDLLRMRAPANVSLVLSSLRRVAAAAREAEKLLVKRSGYAQHPAMLELTKALKLLAANHPSEAA